MSDVQTVQKRSYRIIGDGKKTSFSARHDFGVSQVDFDLCDENGNSILWIPGLLVTKTSDTLTLDFQHVLQEGDNFILLVCG